MLCRQSASRRLHQTGVGPFCLGADHLGYAAVWIRARARMKFVCNWDVAGELVQFGHSAECGVQLRLILSCRRMHHPMLVPTQVTRPDDGIPVYPTIQPLSISSLRTNDSARQCSGVHTLMRIQYHPSNQSRYIPNAISQTPLARLSSAPREHRHL